MKRRSKDCLSPFYKERIDMDARSVYTKRRIRDGYIGIINEKNDAHPSVAEISAAADINRTTFYNHYTNQHQLMNHIIDDQTDALARRIRNYNPIDMYGLCRVILMDIRENLDIYRAIFAEDAESSWKSRFYSFCSDNLKDGAWIDLSLDTQRTMLQYIINGSMGVISEWVRTGMKEPKDKVFDFLDAVTAAATIGASELMFKNNEAPDYSSLDRLRGMKRIYKSGGLCIDDRKRIVTVEGREVELTNTEYEILMFFMKNKGSVISGDEVVEVVWGDTKFLSSNTLAVYIHRLRNKIENDRRNPKYIKAVWGVGYKLIDYEDDEVVA